MAKEQKDVLLSAISKAYRNVKTAIKYDRDTLTPKAIINSLKSKALELKCKKHNGNFESLFVICER